MTSTKHHERTRAKWIELLVVTTMREASGLLARGSRVLLGVVVVLAACAQPAARNRGFGSDDVILEAQPRVVLVATSTAAGAFVARAWPEALVRVRALSLDISRPFTVRVDDDVDAFVRNTGRTDHFLRAWSTPTSIDLLPPSTWRERDPSAIVERLAHEVCHVALAHLALDRGASGDVSLPRFFQEGTCSVAAGQVSRRLPLAQVAPVCTEEALVASAFVADATVAYSLAHHLMQIVVDERGADAIRRLTVAFASSTNVPETMLNVTGRTLPVWCERMKRLVDSAQVSAP